MAKVSGNFKNIAKTVAQHHQQYMCYVLSNPSDYLQSEQVMGLVVTFDLSCLEYKAKIIADCPNVTMNSIIQSIVHCVCGKKLCLTSQPFQCSILAIYT